ncbi:MAG: U32 family peptidase [Bacteroidia bacterium]|nr:U32 family peptidase [Bacteroidia bacterium]
MKILELLAPARNMEIGIAAIDCGADAVYIAAESFGARKDACNRMADIAALCAYAHKFGARIFLTVNTIIYDRELEQVHRLMIDAQAAGVDAFIVQDPALTAWDDITVPLHASTQCAIRTPETAKFYESLGFARLVVERETSLEQLKAIREAVDCELEYFVHGALCVCYSGNCYLSEQIAGRSANRGACIQACRSLYDLVDEEGNVLVKNKALLSLKDYNLKNRLQDLAEAGVCSFKIEGRLKNASYVKNVVREYSLALDALIAAHPGEYMRSSFGRVSGGFVPAADKTFNRGYTELWFDGKRGKWSSMDAPKSMGEYIGTVSGIRKTDRFNIEIGIAPVSRDIILKNGDGFAFAGKNGIIGFRGDVCEGRTIVCKSVEGLQKGARLFRNINSAFERELERNMPRREIRVSLDVTVSGKYSIDIKAVSEDGREVLSPFKTDLETAENRERQEALIKEQLSKRSGHYSFSVKSLEVKTPGGTLPLVSASILNSMRRLVASDLEALPCGRMPLADGSKDGTVHCAPRISYKSNVANDVARGIYAARGAEVVEDAYEITHREDVELMRTRYCIRYELGLCPVHQGATSGKKLYLLNNGKKFALNFDCKACEMTINLPIFETNKL